MKEREPGEYSWIAYFNCGAEEQSLPRISIIREARRSPISTEISRALSLIVSNSRVTLVASTRGAFYTLNRVKIRDDRRGKRKKNRAYLYDRNRSGMHGQVYVQLRSDTPLRGTVPSMVIRGTRCKCVPATLRTETRIKRVICLVFEGKGKTFVQLDKGKSSRYWINICSAHGRTPLFLSLSLSVYLLPWIVYDCKYLFNF